MHVHRSDGSDDDVIGESVALMPASAATASEAVMTVLCDLSPADATVRPHEGCSDAQTDGDPQLLVAQAKAEVCRWQCIEPGARTRCDESEETCAVDLVSSLKQAIGFGRAHAIVPLSLHETVRSHRRRSPPSR